MKKGLLKLNDDDFREHDLYELLREHGPAEKIGEAVFHDRHGDDHSRTRPARRARATAERAARPILVFSPHPDDDVISMGGTLIRLVEQGHKVHIAYMTSGNIAVFDHDARRFVDFVDEFLAAFGIDGGAVERRHDQGAGLPVPRRQEARPAGHRTTC